MSSLKDRAKTIQIIRKDNDLVQAKYHFNIWETRLFLFLITQISKGDNEDSVYRIWYKDVKQSFGLSSNRSYEFLRKAAEDIGEKSVVVHWQNDEGGNRQRKLRLVRYVDTEDQTKPKKLKGTEDYVEIALDKDIIPMLLDIRRNYDPTVSRYTSYQLRDIRKLKVYGVRLYEIFKQNAFRGECVLKIDTLREMLELTDKYKQFGPFYNRIIKSSVEDINEYTDLEITNIEKVSRGRKIVELHFTIRKKKDTVVQALRGDTEQESVSKSVGSESKEVRQFEDFKSDVIDRFAVTPKKFIKILEEGNYTDEQIRNAIQVTNRAKYKKQIRKSVAGYFIKALVDGYTDDQTEKERLERERNEKMKTLEDQLVELSNERHSQIRDAVRTLKGIDAKIVDRAIETIRSSPFNQELIASKEEVLERELRLEDFRKDGDLYSLMMTTITLENKEFVSDFTRTVDSHIQKVKMSIANLKGG